MPIYIIRTIGGKEEVIAEMIANKAISENLQIYSAFKIEEFKGYVFVEGEEDDVMKVIKEIPHIRSVIKQTITLEELSKYIKKEEKEEIKLEVNDIVEIIGGPFKGLRGKVIKVDEIKKEVTVELLDVAVSLPVTISLELVRIVEKAKK
ncbi:MAG: transcription elongation factor Spt5 [Candidatus Aenigmatarchaeota archaeon]